MRVRYIFFLYLIQLVLSLYSSAYAFDAEVLPSEINQGDAFVIKVTGVKTSGLPEAFFSEKSFNFSSCGKGCFVAIGAAGMDISPGIHFIKLNVGSEEANINLTVKHVDFPTISLTLPEDMITLSPENLRRAGREAEKLESLWKRVSNKLWKGSFILPLENKTSTVFGTKRIMNKKKISVHKGVDIKGKKGEAIKAFNKGRVLLAEELFFGGNTIILDHGQGIFSIYMHMSGYNAGHQDVVSKGDIIGFVGSSGRATGPHLHFGVKVQNINVNPFSFVELDL